jgi:HAD superfamily hydrolase (TIGR01459 family)
VSRPRQAAGTTPLQTSIAELTARYEALLFDAYGVLVHGDGILPGARAALERIESAGKRYLLVSNDASKLPQNAAVRYRRFGLPVDAEHILSSGQLLKPYFQQHGLAGARCVVLGPADSERYVELAGGKVVPIKAEFDALVIGDETGYPFLATVDAALSALVRHIDSGRQVRLLLPNPDLIYPSRDGFGLAAGSIALVFEAALQRRYPGRADLRFIRLGKPEPHLYEEAMRRLGTRSVVMIGDQLETDIAGANAAGIDSALLTTGVSTADFSSLPDALRPTWWMPQLQ